MAGKAFDYVLLSTVRWYPASKIDRVPSIPWKKKHIGNLLEKGYVTMAMTRAKKGLIIVGKLTFYGGLIKNNEYMSYANAFTCNHTICGGKMAKNKNKQTKKKRISFKSKIFCPKPLNIYFACLTTYLFPHLVVEIVFWKCKVVYASHFVGNHFG